MVKPLGEEVSSSPEVHHPCVLVPCRRLLCRVRSPRSQDHGVSLYLQLRHCRGICGVFHWLEPDPGVPHWHCGWRQRSEQHVRLVSKPHHQPLDGGQRGSSQWPGWDCHVLLPQPADSPQQINGFPFQDSIWRNVPRALNMSFFFFFPKVVLLWIYPKEIILISIKALYEKILIAALFVM